MWARNNVVSERCPKSIITAESLHYLEVFALSKRMGKQSPWEMEAKMADAIILLEQAWQEENQQYGE